MNSPEADIANTVHAALEALNENLVFIRQRIAELTVASSLGVFVKHPKN